jgi:hypothetical protein
LDLVVKIQQHFVILNLGFLSVPFRVSHDTHQKSL